MFMGRHDILGTIEDATWTKDQIGSDVFHFQKINGSHASFCIGKDMTYFTEDVMGILKQYQPIPF